MAAFQEAMASDSRFLKMALIKGLDSVLDGLGSVVDVGGGNGTAAKIICEAFNKLKCTVLDLPETVANLSGNTNVSFVGGDMLKSILQADAVLFKLIAVVATHHSALPPELYWKSMLPTTPMPKSITDLLHPPVHAGKSGDGAIVLGARGRRRPKFEFVYGRPAHHPKTKLHDNPNTALFFLEKDLKSGHKMNFLFEKSSNQASFLPRDVVQSIPFSSSKMAEILNKFAVKLGSIDAEVMKSTIEVCEESGIKGEDKYCATSLESMVNFTILKLGKNVLALSTEVMKKETEKQEYRIMREVKKVGEANLVVCHQLNYVYAVFYCHKTENSVAYTVSLEGADWSTVKAVSVCHRDTSQWNPKHLAFQMLKVKPGSVPICHFLLQDSIAWVPKQN